MKWDEILSDVACFYFRLGFVYFAYLFAKVCTARSRSSSKPPVLERLWDYLRCAGVVAFIALLASGNYEHDEEGKLISMDYNRGMVVFLVLLIAVLFGANAGYTTSDKYHAARESDDGCDW
jgi:hypothetical protein